NVRGARPEDAAGVLALLAAADLDAEFVARESVVAEDAGRIVGCARLRPLAGGAHELASVAVERGRRGTRIGARVVARALTTARGRVYALALAPGFFAKLGFRRIADVPRELADKAATRCSSTPFVTMVLDSPASVAGANEKEVAR
ncbi:MAG: GNAT family N-acetyltransferase, partial [Thermoplasmatota archaeon]